MALENSVKSDWAYSIGGHLNQESYFSVSSTNFFNRKDIPSTGKNVFRHITKTWPDFNDNITGMSLTVIDNEFHISFAFEAILTESIVD
jgi:hypothetical protein